MFDQQNHPELRDGEVWLTNTDPKDFNVYGYKTKRMGVIAYARDGSHVDGLRPVFVQKSEYDEKMKDIRKWTRTKGASK